MREEAFVAGDSSETTADKEICLGKFMKGDAEVLDVCYLITSGMSVSETSKEAVEEGLEKMVNEERKDTKGMDVMERELYGESRARA